MFLRAKTRKKDGKEHRYWSMVENRRVADCRVVQRHVLYLGEINSSQELGWRRTIDPSASSPSQRSSGNEAYLRPSARPQSGSNLRSSASVLRRS